MIPECSMCFANVVLSLRDSRCNHRLVVDAGDGSVVELNDDAAVQPCTQVFSQAPLDIFPVQQLLFFLCCMPTEAPGVLQDEVL